MSIVISIKGQKDVLSIKGQKDVLPIKGQLCFSYMDKNVWNIQSAMVNSVTVLWNVSKFQKFHTHIRGLDGLTKNSEEAI